MQPNLQIFLTNVMDRLGLVALMRRVAASRRGLVLALNRVLPSGERSFSFERSLVVTESAFASLLQILSQDFQVIHLEELLAKPQGESGRPRVAITFDDGWEDNYRVAFPHLVKYQMPATIFACTDLLDTSAVLPEERFSRLWSQCASRSTLRELLVDLRHWGLGKRRNRSQRMQKRYWSQELKRMPLTGRLLLLDHFEQRFRIPPVSSRRLLSWQEIRVMTQTGLIRMGSHTCRHATLPSETDRDVRRELEGSRQALWEHTGILPKIVSYPNGMYNPRVLDMVRSIGFQWGLTGQSGLVSMRSNPLCIPRIAVRAAVDDMALPRGEMHFSSSRTSVYFFSSWLKSAMPAGAEVF